ncbi:MAG: alpha/beta hydrolase [Acidobacteria bacterium]|nr:alpha/beta hydrolase [Acidobacteriota bacterium]
MKIAELKFTATPDKGDVSALLLRPENATHLLVLGHGASSNMHTPMLATIAENLAEQGIATFRYNFPYSEKGGGRNSQATCLETIRSAVRAASEAAPDLPILAGGHSFSGRMTSTAQSESPIEGVKGLVFFAFPLHPAGEPAIKRAEHLKQIDIPMLFLSGTRDALCELDLLEPVVQGLGEKATLHLLDTADHSFKILKRTRQSTEDVFAEMARITRDWSGKIAV